MKQKAFTLVELIVVISILAVLGTLGFVSFQGYSQTARDSVRISDMKVMEKSLEFELTKNDSVPYPTDYITLTASGTIIGYQGYAGLETLGKIGISDTILDPLDETLYTYATNQSRTKYQLLGFLEAELSQSIVLQTYADMSNRIPLLRGNELGILFDSLTYQPAQDIGLDIDIQNTSTNYELFLNNNDGTKSGSGGLLSSLMYHRIYSESNCSTFLKNSLSKGNGIYTSTPNGTGSLDIYCDMATQGGGWSLLSKVPGNSQTFGNRGLTGIWNTPEYNFSLTGLLDDTEYLSPAYESLITNEILLCHSNMTMCHNFKHNKNIAFADFMRNGITYMDYSFNLNGYSDTGDITIKQNFLQIFGLPAAQYTGHCSAVGINIMNGGKTSTSNILGLGGDNDGPCITRNNSQNSTIDNYSLGVAGKIYYTSSSSYGYVTEANLAGYTSYNMNGSTQLLSTPSLYISDTWYIFGR